MALHPPPRAVQDIWALLRLLEDKKAFKAALQKWADDKASAEAAIRDLEAKRRILVKQEKEVDAIHLEAGSMVSQAKATAERIVSEARRDTAEDRELLGNRASGLDEQEVRLKDQAESLEAFAKQVDDRKREATALRAKAKAEMAEALVVKAKNEKAFETFKASL